MPRVRWVNWRYITPDPGAKGDAKKGIYPFPVADFFDKGITMGSGQAPVKKYNEYLRDLIVNGRAKPSKIVSHRIDIDEAPDAYEKSTSGSRVTPRS